MFFRRVFAKNHHNNGHGYGKMEMFEETTSSDRQSPPSPPPSVKMIQKRRASIEEKPSRGLSGFINLTPIAEHIIRTNSLPPSVNVPDVFDEFYERLHDPEWQVRQHALRVLVDVLIVMGQQADYYIGNLVHPLVDNLGHIAPAVRKGALDALRVYVAQTAMPETVMLDIMTYGMDRPVKDPFSGRMTVAVMLALPALILPILITSKRAYVVKAVIDSLASKMVQITYQEIALKILLKIKDMVGINEFNEHIPLNVKKDFELLCKVYGLPKSPNSSRDDLHVPSSHDSKNPWSSKFVPRKDSQGNAPVNIQDANKYFGGNYDATYPFERTRLTNNLDNLGTPKRVKSPRQGSAGIVRSSSDNQLSVDFNGNSSGSESGGSSMSLQTLQTQNNTAANSKSATGIKSDVGGKVIMETEIKITPETAVTMRILERNPSTQTDDSDDENESPRITADFSAPYPVTPMKARNIDDNNNFKLNTDNELKRGNGRRVRFGGEIIKMRTPDSDVMDQSDNDSRDSITQQNLKPPLQKENSNLSDDNSSISSDNSTTNEYIKQTNVGYVNEPLSSLNQLRSNIGNLREKKFENFIRKNPEPSSFTRAIPLSASSSRPVSARSNVFHSPPTTPKVVHSPSLTVRHDDPKRDSSSSTDYSQELTIGIPDNETVLPAHFTPPSIMIKKAKSQSYNQIGLRPATSPMLSPRIVTIPPTSSSNSSSKYNSPIKSAPTTPIISPSKAYNRSSSPERTPIRRSVSSLSPRMMHREVTMMHNLQRSPMSSPARNRRASIASLDGSVRAEEATQTSVDNPKLDEMTQTPNGYTRIDEMTQTSIIGEAKFGEKVINNSADSTPMSSNDSPVIRHMELKSWEELGIVDYFVLKDLKSGVSPSITSCLAIRNRFLFFVCYPEKRH